MGGSAWKVAYADFVTALMAFFLMMWILNMASEETKAGLADYFQEVAVLQSGAGSGTGPGKSAWSSTVASTVQSLSIGDGRLSEAEKANYAIAQKLRHLMSDAAPQSASGLSADDVGVQLRVNNDALFAPGSATITDPGKVILNNALAILKEYNVYLVVRGHADSGESDNTLYPSPWELSAARAATVVRYLVDKDIKPTRMRAVAYGDTRPVEPGDTPENRSRNRRVEFFFHRPEAMTYSIVY